MKNMIKTFAVLVILQVAFAWSYQVIGQEKDQKSDTETIKYWVSMDCEKCKAKIEKNVPFEKGVTGLAVDLPTKTVSITYKPKKTSPEKLKKAIQDLGYKTEVIPNIKKQ